MIKLYTDLETKLNAKLDVKESRKHGDKNGKGATVQFNIKPFKHLNAIHFALFQIMSVCNREGYKCIIILTDKSVLFGNNTTIETASETRESMDLFYGHLLKYKLDQSKIEVIPESKLWLFASFKDKALENIVKLAYSINNKKNTYIDSGLLPNTFPDLTHYMNVQLSLIYESILKPDFIVTVEEEMTPLWKSVRNRDNHSANIFGINYIPPVMIIMETIKRYNSNLGLKTGTDDDPFCECMNKEDLLKLAIQSVYEQTIMRYHKIAPLAHAENVLDVIKAFRQKVYDET